MNRNLAMAAAASLVSLSLLLGQSMSSTQARNESVKRWGPAGSIRQQQTGKSTVWLYETGVVGKYGFEPRGEGKGNWANAFVGIPVTYNLAIQEASVAYGRLLKLQVGRDPDARAPDPIAQMIENEKHRMDAEDRLVRFVQVLCRTVPKGCDAAGKEFRVRILPDDP